jgi:heat shock protein HtpX
MTTTKQSTFGATIRTTILLASLTGLLVLIGALIGGPSTAALFLGIGLLLNLGSYFFSDKLALKMSGAKPLEESEAPRIYQIVRELTTRAGLPMPRLYIIPQEQPNAFATGRNPKHAAVAVTQGITKLLSEDELRGVLAHELAHVQHRDILIQSVAAAIGGAITYIAYMLLWFGGEDNSPLGLVASLSLVLLAPIAASIIQLSIPMKVNQAAEPLYIVKPFSGSGLSRLFSTHPPIEERVRRLRQMRPSLG